MTFQLQSKYVVKSYQCFFLYILWFRMSHSAIMLMLDFSDSVKGQSWNGFLKKRELIASNFKQQMT